MRCPKCGYISFDNVGTCLKCKKDISSATNEFLGSTLNVPTPSFLKFDASEEEMEIEGAAEVGGEIEFADPDLEILMDDDEDEEASEEGELALAEEFGDIETFGDDEEEDDLDLSADLGVFEDVSEEDTFSFEDDSDDSEEDDASVIGMDIPDELADISDLSPPDNEDEVLKSAEFESESEPEAPVTLVEEETPPPAAEPEDDLDFSSLDMDLDLDEPEAPAVGLPADSVEAAEESSSGMDEELNFDLDLGGLSIHDDLK